jgi:hypothetical protein
MDNYNNYKLFTWNPDNLLYNKDNNNYNDVYLHTGTIIKNQWENCICTTEINNSIKIISNSNHFLHGPNWGVGYNNQYKIYDNLVKNFMDIQNVKELGLYVNNDLFNNNTYFYMMDSFSFSNSGHNLSNVLNMTDYIIINNIKNILIPKNYKNTHNFKLINLLLPKDCVYIELNENCIYKINNIIIIHPNICNIQDKLHLIDQLKNTISLNYSELFNNCKNKNIILMKTNRNKNVMLKHTQIHCEKLICMLEQNEYINLIPEEMNIFELCIYIMYANKIIFSDGSVIYTNKIFINESSKLIGITYNKTNVWCFHNLKNINLLGYTNNNLTDEECIDMYNQIINY